MKTILLTIIITFTINSAYSQDKFKEINNAQDVIDNFITAIGGRDKIGEIRSETVSGDLNVQGMEIGFMTFRNDTLSFSKAEGEAHGTNMLLMKSVTTKTSAWEYQMTGIKDYVGEELLNKQTDMITGNLGFVLNYDKLGYSFELEGTDTVNGKPCYMLVLSKDGKKLRTNYYDKETFFLVKLVKPNDVSIDVYDYREVSGAYRPFKIIQNSPMELTITFKDYVFNKMIDTELLSKPADK
jgi:hypothetical protein